MIRPIVLVLAVAVLSSGCRKPLPSPDYIEASNRYTSLLAMQGDDAFASAAMDELIAQLGRVSPKSSDHAAAVALIATITAERARVASAAAQLAIVPPAPAPNFPAFAPIAAPVEPPSEPIAADAGINELGRGADFASLQRKYVGCVLSRGPITMIGADGGSSSTDSYELHDSASCRSRLPGFGANVLLVQGGKIAYLLPASTFKTVATLEDGGALPAP